MTVINVEIPGKPTNYDIVVERGLVENCSKHFEQYNHVAVVTDETVDKLFGEQMIKSLPNASKLVVPSGEDSKCFEYAIRLTEDFAEIGLLRNSAVVCFGGGMVGDLAGFAASLYMRGIDYYQFPTTLVAMVDSAIGGKTGINIPAGKNLVGAFKQPKGVLIDPDLISGLPEREVRNGLGEMVKHALFADLSLVDALVADPKSEESIIRSAQIKVDIIQDDVLESGKRKWLNVGHTVGHGIEQLSNYELSHGEAVILGTFWESYLAVELGILEGLDEITESFERLDLNYIPERYDLDEVWEIMLHDKKNVSPDKVSMALISKPGKEVQVIEFEKDQFISLSSQFYEKYL